jgi:Bax protein
MKYLAFIYFRDWRHYSLLFSAAVFPLLFALLLTGFVPLRQAALAPFVGEAVPLVSVDTVSARDLQSRFDRVGYVWPLNGEVPPLAVTRFPPDLGSLAVANKKTLFFRTLLPLVMAENERIERARSWLEGVMRNGYFATRAQRMHMQSLLEEYGLDTGVEVDTALLEELYRRVDVIPPGLALAQAANESGWGTSRFCREGNNLFGEWTFRAKEGIVPLRRRDGAEHYVRRFGSVRESVRSYFNNLNRNRAYKSLRRLRAEQRRLGREPDALTLADGLRRYSERGSAYVADIRSLIRSNGLNDLGPLHLARSATVD